ncbi:MAG TPA: glycosyltransferase family 39 protein, partial [Herpetosiphonaceae bacterium]
MSRPRIDWQLAILLAAALGLRLLAWLIIPYRDFISDEAEYWGAAVWLGQGRGFAFFDQWVWTRPPAYLLFLAGHVKLFGPSALWAPRLSQALLGTLGVWLLTKIGARLAPAGMERRVGLLAGWALAAGYSFAIFSYVLLSETFFLTLFLAAVLFLLRWAAPAGRRRDLAAAALLLGLCALTRAVVLTWLPLAAFWALAVEHRRRQSWRPA